MCTHCVDVDVSIVVDVDAGVANVDVNAAPSGGVVCRQRPQGMWQTSPHFYQAARWVFVQQLW